MLDIFDFIIEKGGNPEKIRESQRLRYAPVEVVDEVISLYEDHRKTHYAATRVNTKINDIQKQIGAKKKAKENADDLMEQKVALEQEKKSLDDSAAEKDVTLKKKIGSIGNIVHESVPVNNNEDYNTVQRTWAPEGVKVEKKDALINYGLEFLDGKGYTPLQTPQFMMKEYMAKTAQLEQFDEELYKVIDGDPTNDKYLIATSEQPISAFHADEWLVAKDLPIKYAGFSSCYRREAGAHGRDAWGIFRVHQFEKIEQFVLTDPEKSWEAFDNMIGISEEFYQSLGVPYQVIAIVSGALNNAAAKKYDLEAWFPFQGEYKELVSCSNCTDYQSRALEIRYGPKLQTEIRKKYGFNVPEPLRKYLPGAPEFIPFTKELPKDSTSQKTKGKTEKASKPKAAAAIVVDTVSDTAQKLKNATYDQAKGQPNTFPPQPRYTSNSLHFRLSCMLAVIRNANACPRNFARHLDEAAKPFSLEAMEEESICCPFCGFNADNEYQIMLHMETLHSEGDSPFVIKDNASIAAIVALDDDGEVQYASCPVEGCGEAILFSELDSHIDMHGAEGSIEDSAPASKRVKLEARGESEFDTKLSYALRNLDDGGCSSSQSPFSETDRQPSAKAAWKGILKMPDLISKAPPLSEAKGNRRRLGKSELGPHAHEKQMPAWLVKLLQSDGEIKTENRLGADGKMRKVKVCANQNLGLVLVLKQLLEQDVTTEYAYLCHPAVSHVSKLPREGGFCGYRNIQMLSSFIINTKSQGHENFSGQVPSIFDIQEYIEHAWDIGINSQGRIETGGIRGTRKYIGTPDAQAMLCSLGIACDAEGLKTKKDGPQAYQLLFQAAESYFVNGCLDFGPKVRATTLPPVYFQHPGHSLTIIGFEKKTDGTKNVIVFDPMFHDATSVTKYVGQTFTHKAPADLLKAYRRGVKYLRRYKEFELLKLTPPKPQSRDH
ncbi:hypothetical protein B7494_g1284 [Chlorociboria aeruginascens]|nr:hypothetical protein B7494_g1284 [Chlorociboria aeruginascens]